MKKNKTKSSTERGQTLTERDNELARIASNGKYPTMRKLTGAWRRGEIKVIVVSVSQYGHRERKP